MYRTRIPGTHNVSVLISNRTNSSSMLRHKSVKVRGPVGPVHSRPPLGTDHATLHPQPGGSYATQALPFRVYTSTEGANFTFGFGDDSPLMWVQGRPRRVPLGSVATAYHRFTRGKNFAWSKDSNKVYTSIQCFNTFHRSVFRYICSLSLRQLDLKRCLSLRNLQMLYTG